MSSVDKILASFERQLDKGVITFDQYMQAVERIMAMPTASTSPEPLVEKISTSKSPAIY